MEELAFHFVFFTAICFPLFHELLGHYSYESHQSGYGILSFLVSTTWTCQAGWRRGPKAKADGFLCSVTQFSLPPPLAAGLARNRAQGGGGSREQGMGTWRRGKREAAWPGQQQGAGG
jgi:hypothetical protein